MSDKDIDTSDIPEIKNWDNAVVGRFYRPIKKLLKGLSQILSERYKEINHRIDKGDNETHRLLP